MDGWKKLHADGMRLFREGSFIEARERFEKALDAARADVQTSGDQLAELQYRLAEVCRRMSRFEQAQSLLEKARVFYRGKDEWIPLYAKTLRELGDLFQVTGRLEDSQNALDEALEIVESHFEGKHKDKGDVYNSMGLLFWRTAEDEKALDFYNQALEQYSATCGKNCGEYGETIDNMGISYQRLGQLDSALEHHTRALRIREQSLGPNHPDLIYSLINLATIKAQLGDSSEYEELAQRAIRISEATLGENSHETALLYGNLGTHFLKKVNYEKAFECYSKSLAINELLHGEDSIRLAVPLHNMGVVQSLLKHSEEARAYKDRAIPLLKKRIKKEDGRDLNTIVYLADCLNSTGEQEEATRLLNVTLDSASNDDPFSPRLLPLLDLLAGLQLDAQGVSSNYELRKEYLVRQLKIQKRAYGKRHATVAKTLRALSSCHQMQGDQITGELLAWQAQAIEFEHGLENSEEQAYIEMLGRQLESGEGDDSSKLATKRTMSTMLRMSGRDEEADALEKEYEDAVKKEMGVDSLQYAMHLKSTAAMVLADPKRAVDLLEESIRIQKNHVDSSFEQLESTYSAMFLPLMGLRDPARTERNMKAVIDLAKEHYGCDHWTIRQFFTQLQEALQEQNKKQELKELQSRIEAIEEPSPEEKQEYQKVLEEKTQKELMESLADLNSMFASLMPGLGADENVELDE